MVIFRVYVYLPEGTYQYHQELLGWSLAYDGMGKKNLFFSACRWNAYLLSIFDQHRLGHLNLCCTIINDEYKQQWQVWFTFHKDHRCIQMKWYEFVIFGPKHYPNISEIRRSLRPKVMFFCTTGPGLLRRGCPS